MSVFEQKRRRTAQFRFEVEDSSEARAELDAARRTLQIVRLSDSEQAKADAQAAFDAAKKTYDDCWRTVTFRQDTHAVEELEQRAAERPSREDEKGYRWWADPESFAVGIISACCVEERLSPQEWVEELCADRWTIQDRRALFEAAMQANARVAYDVGKG